MKELTLVFERRRIDGVDMGILENGIPFLTSRGLARFCGVAPSVIIELVQQWSPDSLRKRDQAILHMLQADGADAPDTLFIPAVENGVRVNAHPAFVCTAIVSYYALDVGKEEAKRALRHLTRKSLRDVIYKSLGYSKDFGPTWKHFIDRVEMNDVPSGYFSVFIEIASIILVPAQRCGLQIDARNMPDISVGIIWSKFWAENNYDTQYGHRTRWQHNFPPSFPQSAVEVTSWIYPRASLGAFRAWLEDLYLPDKYPRYLKKKVRAGLICKEQAMGLIAAVRPRELHTDGGPQ